MTIPTFWSLVRHKRSAEDTATREALYDWIAAYCSEYRGDDMANCTAQRLYRGFAYEFHFRGANIRNLDPLDAFVRGRIDAWMAACETAR